MITYRIEVGRNDDVSPKNIVGAIANEADIDAQFIGHIKLHDDHSTVDLPEGMPKELFDHLYKVRVCQKALKISVDNGTAGEQRDAKPEGTERKKEAAEKTKRSRCTGTKKPAFKGKSAAIQSLENPASVQLLIANKRINCGKVPNKRYCIDLFGPVKLFSHRRYAAVLR